MKNNKKEGAKADKKATFEQIRRFGTYEIQPTADTENQYPFIAQGYNKKTQKTDGERKEAEK